MTSSGILDDSKFFSKRCCVKGNYGNQVRAASRSLQKSGGFKNQERVSLVSRIIRVKYQNFRLHQLILDHFALRSGLLTV